MTELPFIYRKENTARYEDGVVYILDRRIYPFRVEFVRCPTYEEVARAIEEMVTQSGGPGMAAGYGMVQAARQAAAKTGPAQWEALETAARRLIATRPTNNHIRLIVTRMLEAAKASLERGENLEQAQLKVIEGEFEKRNRRGEAIGRYGAEMIHDGDAILNHCWAESGIVYTVYTALQQGKKFSAYCDETRPYLQGSRLTADALADMGVPTTVITDSMPACLMSRGMISSFSGADRVTMDGHVINKVGTLQVAICAQHYGVPYYALTTGPDPKAPTPAQVVMEERNPEDVLHCLGMRTATPKARGYYPAFDITPPDMVSALVTDRGIFSPFKAGEYFQSAPGAPIASRAPGISGAR